MSDLVSRQGVLNILKTLRNHNISVYEYDKWILGMPFAEPNIIYCKDCENYCEPEEFEDAWCCGWGGTTTEDSFCSYAERKTDETD